MALDGEFGSCGLEMRPELVLKKSPRDVNTLLETFTRAAERLEKRSRELETTEQLYELQTQIGLVMSKVQRSLFDTLEKSRRKS